MAVSMCVSKETINKQRAPVMPITSWRAMERLAEVLGGYCLVLGAPSLKVIPQYCIAHIPTAQNFCVISARKRTRARKQRKKFLSRYSEINDHYLLKEHGDLDFFLMHNNRVHIILFNL